MNEPKILITAAYEDNRGLFYESFSEYFMQQNGINCAFIQDNHSISKKNVIRGLHYQWNEPQDKLVRVSNGSIIDVIVDIRSTSKNYGKVFYYELSSSNRKQLWIPAGFAHGFISLEDNTHVQYKTSKKYNSKAESGINPFDTWLNIQWGATKDSLIISDRDKSLPLFQEYNTNPKFYL